MNRELRFRAWDDLLKQMIVTGFHVFGEYTLFNIIGEYLYENLCGKESTLFRYNDVIVTQFTGKKDINNEDIYEGDIVKTKERRFDWNKPSGEEEYWVERIGVVEYRGHGFWIDNEHFGWEGENLWDWDKLEVIGNRFENPELIKKEVDES